MTPAEIAVLLLAGAVAGFIGASCRTSEGVILFPSLLFYYALAGVTSLVAAHLAVATGLTAVTVTALLSSWRSSRTNSVIWKGALIVGAVGAAGACAGGVIVSGMEGRSIALVYAGIAVLSAVRLVARQRKPKGEQETQAVLPATLGAGFLAGVATPLSGVEGGGLLGAALYTIQRYPLMKAFGTAPVATAGIAGASAVALVIAGWGNVFLPPSAIGYVDYRAAVLLIAGEIPGAVLGGRVQGASGAESLRRVVAVSLLVVAVKLAFFGS